jgi:hypothetical protein
MVVPQHIIASATQLVIARNEAIPKARHFEGTKPVITRDEARHCEGRSASLWYGKIITMKELQEFIINHCRWLGRHCEGRSNLISQQDCLS